jgi:hypothetical protein
MSRSTAFLGSVLAALCLSVPAAWAAGPVPAGPVFRVSQCTTCKQELPSIAGSKNGAFLVDWEGSSAVDRRGVLVRAFNATGVAQGGDRQVNRELLRPQYDAAVALDSKGNYLVAWAESNGDNSDVLVQKLRPTGAPLGTAFKVNVDDPASPTPPTDFNPAIATGTDGGFTVVWLRVVPPGVGFPGGPAEVFARRFNAAGAPLGAQVKVSTGLIEGDRPDVCIDSSNRAVAVWTSVDRSLPFEPNKKGVAGRLLAPAGAVQGAVILVAPPEYAQLTEPVVSCGKGGTFVVAWTTDRAPGAAGLSDVVGRRFTRLARPAGPAFRLNSRTAGGQRSPSILHDAAGNFVAVWESEDGQAFGIYGRGFTGAGVASGDDFEAVAEVKPTTKPSDPDLAYVGPGGHFVVVWQDGTSSILGRRFKPAP